MLNIYLCEDIDAERHRIAKIIEDFILIENVDMCLALSTSDPMELVALLGPDIGPGIYFLDIKLNASIDGIELASRIRQYDSAGTIVFVTTHDEMLPFTFQYKVEAMDYIIKDTPNRLQSRLRECLKSIVHKYATVSNSLSPIFSVKVGALYMYIRYKDILFFETAAIRHQVIIHTVDGSSQFYGSLIQLEKQMGKYFFRCHRSYLINIEHIVYLDSAKHKITLTNRETLPVSAHSMSAAKLKLKELHPFT